MVIEIRTPSIARRYFSKVELSGQWWNVRASTMLGGRRKRTIRIKTVVVRCNKVVPIKTEFTF